MKLNKTFLINKPILTLFFISFFILSYAQAPQKIGYQTEIRNLSGALVTNTIVGIKTSILKGAINGNPIYIETHLQSTNSSGLVSLEIGQGNVILGTFSDINWNNGPYFIKTETDPFGGSNYIITATSQFLSVPYAFYAGNGIKSLSAFGDTVYLNSGNSFIIPGISAANIIQGNSCYLPYVFNDSINYGTLTDQEGNTYKTVEIGAQVWMAENLRTSIYRNGDPIGHKEDYVLWDTVTSGLWTYYRYDSLYNCPTGKEYNYYAVVDSRNLCPAGWHVPSEIEWDTLIQFIEPGADYQINTAGNALKSLGASIWQVPYWHLPNTNATNSTGFSGIPGGRFDGAQGSFVSAGEWWSNTTYYLNNNNGVTFFLDSSITPESARIGNLSKYTGLSVRCLKD